MAKQLSEEARQKLIASIARNLPKVAPIILKNREEAANKGA